jgi:hypothetical protein
VRFTRPASLFEREGQSATERHGRAQLPLRIHGVLDSDGGLVFIQSEEGRLTESADCRRWPRRNARVPIGVQRPELPEVSKQINISIRLTHLLDDLAAKTA